MKKWHELLFEFLSGLLSKQGLRGAGAGPEAMKGALTFSQPLGSGYDADREENEKRAHIVKFCRQQIGEPYQFGVEGPSDRDLDSWDCSEIVEHAYRQAGMIIPDGTMNQRPFCQKVRQPRPGDLAFLGPNKNGIGHVVLYQGFESCVEARGNRVQGIQKGKVVETSRAEIEAHPRFLGWYRHPDFSRPKEDRI